MIRLHASPLPDPLPVSKLDRQHTGRFLKRDNLLKDEGEEGAGMEPNHKTEKRKLGHLKIIQYSQI